jgi:glutathione S-transferase
MFIAEKNIDIPVVEVDLANGEQHKAHFASLNPFRTVPVLELDSGEVLTSSTAIVHYLEGVFPEPALMGSSVNARALIMDLDWRIEQDGFMAIGEAFRNRAKSFANHALTGRHEYAQIPALVERGAHRTGLFFAWLDELLADRTYLAGDNFTLADITAFVSVEFARWIKQTPTSTQENLQRWHAEVSQRSSAKV